MSDLIDREAVIDAIADTIVYGESLGYVRAEEIVSEIPSVENKGEWIRFKNFENGYYHIKCSKCGQYWSIDDHAKIFKYCFNCGADMRGET